MRASPTKYLFCPVGCKGKLKRKKSKYGSIYYECKNGHRTKIYSYR